MHPNDQYLAVSDDYGDSAGSRIVWIAPASGEYHVAVSAWIGTGTYTLTISLADIADDHASTPEGATAVAVQEAVQGSLDYDNDMDYFVFQGEEDKVYQIDVDLGTFFCLLVGLYDGDDHEQPVTSNDNYDGSLTSRIVWMAPRSGEHYVAVSGYGTGSYTLTMAETT